MKETVAIIGSHARTRNRFDFTRSDCDVWLFNEALSRPTLPGDSEDLKQFQAVRRADAVFQMHVPAVWMNPRNANDPGHFDWLKTQNVCDVYMQEQYPEVPRAVRFPLEEIVAHFGVRFFSSSPEYAIALAVYQGYRRIEIYGIEMETNTEYAYQRVGMAYWIGMARGRGVEVAAHMSLFDAPLYGYDGKIALDYADIETRLTLLKPQIEAKSGEYSAARIMLERQLGAVADGDNSEAIIQAVTAVNQTGFELGVLEGQANENLRYRDKADQMKAVSREYYFSRQEFETGLGLVGRQLKEAEAALQAYSGQMEALHGQLVKAAKGSPRRKGIFAEYHKALTEFLRRQREYSILYGIATENMRYMKVLDPFVRAAGGRKSEEAIMGGDKGIKSSKSTRGAASQVGAA